MSSRCPRSASVLGLITCPFCSVVRAPGTIHLFSFLFVFYFLRCLLLKPLAFVSLVSVHLHIFHQFPWSFIISSTCVFLLFFICFILCVIHLLPSFIYFLGISLDRFVSALSLPIGSRTGQRRGSIFLRISFSVIVHTPCVLQFFQSFVLF